MRSTPRAVRARRLALALALTAGLALVGPAAAPGHAQIPPPPPPPVFPFPIPVLPGVPAPGPLGPPILGHLDATELLTASSLLGQFAALNRGDLGGVMSRFVDSPIYSVSDGVGLCGNAPCTTRPTVLAEMDRQIAVHTSFTPLGVDVTGNVVTGFFDIRSDRVRVAGAERLLGTVISEVRGDRVVSIRVLLLRDDPQTLTFINWAAAQALAAGPAGGAPPPAGTPATAPAAGAASSVLPATATLAPAGNSGVSGQASITPGAGNTTVTVTLAGLAPGSAHAGHIHNGGCSGAILFPLATIMADSTGNGTATATVSAAIDTTTWWVQYHASDSPPGPPIACGQVMLAS